MTGAKYRASLDVAPPGQYRTTHTPNLESRPCSVLGQIVFPEAKCRNCKAWQVKAGRLEERRVFQVGSLQSLVRLVVTWRGGAGTVHPSQSEREAKCRQMRENACQPATSGEMTGDARQDTGAGSGRNDAEEARFISHNTSPRITIEVRSNQRATWPLSSEAQGSMVFDCGCCGAPAFTRSRMNNACVIHWLSDPVPHHSTQGLAFCHDSNFHSPSQRDSS